MLGGFSSFKKCKVGVCIRWTRAHGDLSRQMRTLPRGEHGWSSGSLLFLFLFLTVFPPLWLHPQSVKDDFKETKRLDYRALSLVIEMLTFRETVALQYLISFPFPLPCSSPPSSPFPWILFNSSLHSDALKPLVSPSTDNEATEVVWASMALELVHGRRVD